MREVKPEDGEIILFSKIITDIQKKRHTEGRDLLRKLSKRLDTLQQKMNKLVDLLLSEKIGEGTCNEQERRLNYDRIWPQMDMRQKQMFHRAVFQHGLTYDGAKIKKPEMPVFFNTLKNRRPLNEK